MTTTDHGLLRLLDDVGEEAFGLQWLALRPFVKRWVDANPERVYWLVRRVRALVRRGEL